MPRLLGIVENIAPIPLDSRIARVQLVSLEICRISVASEMLVDVLRDLYVPYMDHQVLVKTVRNAEADDAARVRLSDEDVAFYVDNFDQSKKKSSAADVAKLGELETKITLEQIVRLRTRALGLAAFFRPDEREFSIAELNAVAQEFSTRPENIMFKIMEIGLRWDNFSLSFVEHDRQVAEMVVIGFGVNLHSFAVPEGEAKKTLEIDLALTQAMFVVNVTSSLVGPTGAPASKIMYADFSKVATRADSLVPPQMVNLHLSQYQSGEQSVQLKLSNAQLIVSAQALEYFLLYVDRLTTGTSQVLAEARPPAIAVAEAESSSASAVAGQHEANKAAQEVSMAPFSMLGGMLLSVDMRMDDCQMVLLPSDSFSKSLTTDINVSTVSQDYVVNCQVSIPASLQIIVKSSRVKETVEMNVTNFGIAARYVEGVSEVEHILSPTSMLFRFTLEQDKNERPKCHQNLEMQIPDVMMAGSDLSLSLLASCGQALGGIQTTTPEHARLKAESQAKQDEMRRQAEVDAVLTRLHQLFDEIDEDKNGNIELSELLLLLRRVKVGDTLLESELEHFVRELFKDIDRDGSGLIEFDELRAYLRDDMLTGAANATSPSAYDGSGALNGFLNLRGNEYHSFTVIDKLCDTKVTNMQQVEEWLQRPAFQGRFWELFENETRVVNHSFGEQLPLDVQKKLVRLLQNYEAAKLCWDQLVLPAITDAEKDNTICEWLLQPFAHCGGISEYRSAAKVIAKKKKDGIFSAALEEAEQLVTLSQVADPVKKQLEFTTDIQMGNLRFVLTDVELPARFCRGDFVVRDVKLSLELSASDINEVGAIDWAGLATSDHCEWTALFGVKIASSCYSELVNDMEYIIEPWDIVAGLSSGREENGFSVLVEAAKRFQINVTPGVLKTYRALMDALDGEAQRNALQKHQEGFRSAVSGRTHESSDCLVQNLTGAKVTIQWNGSDERVTIAAGEHVHIEGGVVKDGVTTLDRVEIEQWGASTKSTAIPAFGTTNIGVSTDGESPSTLFVTAVSRLENLTRQRVVLKPNLYFINHSSQTYEVKYLEVGGEGRQSTTSPVVTLRPNARIALPVTVLMGITEFYARPEHYEQWIVKASLNDDVLTSGAATNELAEYESVHQTKITQRRGGAIVYGETEETSSKVLKQLTPNVILRRWFLRSKFEWELALLPPFVVRNSLPYSIEYRFVEYRTKSSKNVIGEFARLEGLLHGEIEPDNGNDVLHGVVKAGLDAEVSGVSGLYPGYMSMRLVKHKDGRPGSEVYSQWSKPLLMAVHGKVESFMTAQEVVDLGAGVQFKMDRITQPNQPRIVRFFSPYWIINNTSVKFALASTTPGAKKNSLSAMDLSDDFSYPVMTSLANDRLSLKPLEKMNERPKAWSFLGSMPASSYTSTAMSEHAVQNAEWSEPMNTTTVNTVGECVCGPSVFAVKLEGLYGVFEPGIALTFSPRYFVQNNLDQQLFVQTFATTETDPARVDDLFHKRTAEDVKALQASLENGQTTPVYHFATLKKNESMAACQRYISFSFSDEWGGDATKAWSFAIPINAAGDVFLQMYSPKRERSIICQASVQVVDMYVYVILSDVSSAPPYRIENYTPFTITCSQLGESSFFRGGGKETSAEVKSGEWHSFAWHNPLSKERIVEIKSMHIDAPKPQVKKYDVDYVGYLDPITMHLAPEGEKKREVEIVVQVVVEESTRVLRFVERELELSRLENQDAQIENEFQQRKMLFASSFDIRMDGFGMSLFDAYPQEVFFLSADSLQVEKPPASLQWTVSLFHFQVDNMLSRAKFPVIMNPADTGYSDKSVGKDAEPEPFIKLILDADLAARVGTYKLLEFALGDLAVKVDIDYLVTLVKLVDPYLVSDATLVHRSMLTLERTLSRRVPAVPVVQVTGPDGGGIQTDLVYFDMLRIQSIAIDLEYSITRKDIAGDAGAGGRSVVFGLISQVIGLIGSNLSGSPSFNFSEIVIMRCFTTKARLQSQLIQNFVRQGVMQAYRLVGSVDIIGNPIGLVEDLGSGVVEFLKITKGELVGDSQTRGEGVKVLGKTIVKSGASSVAKITGSLDRFVGEFADDSEDEAAAGAGDDSNQNAGLKFAKDLGKGFTGIFTKPVEGAMKGGVTGLVQGTVKGITGPGVVLLKGLTSTSHNLALGVQSTVVDRSPYGGRRRKPKELENVSVTSTSGKQPTKLMLEVIGASALASDKSCDPLCVVRVDGVDVLTTRVLYNTVNPLWQEKMQLGLKGSEDNVELVVKDSYGGTVAKTVGKCFLSMPQLIDDFAPPEYASDLAEWVHTKVRPGDIKKNTSHIVTEKEYPLVMLRKNSGGGSFLGIGGGKEKHAPLLGDEPIQIVVTVKSLRDLRVSGSMGGGLLGLGNLGSATPNISPYVSLRAGKSASLYTNVTKMTFTDPAKKGDPRLGSATWNESVTFKLHKKDLKPGEVNQMIVAIKDKGVLSDERIAVATVPMASLGHVDGPVETLELPLMDGSGKQQIGVLDVEVEVASASTSSRSLSVTSLGGGDSPPAAASSAPEMSDALRAGKIRISCEFE